MLTYSIIFALHENYTNWSIMNGQITKAMIWSLKWSLCGYVSFITTIKYHVHQELFKYMKAFYEIIKVLLYYDRNNQRLIKATKCMNRLILDKLSTLMPRMKRISLNWLYTMSTLSHQIDFITPTNPFIPLDLN